VGRAARLVIEVPRLHFQPLTCTRLKAAAMAASGTACARILQRRNLCEAGRYYVRSELHRCRRPREPQSAPALRMSTRKPSSPFPRRPVQSRWTSSSSSDSDERRRFRVPANRLPPSPPQLAKTAPPAAAAARRAPKAAAGRVRAREARSAADSQENVGILGAGELEMDNARRDDQREVACVTCASKFRKNAVQPLAGALSERVRK